MSTTVSVELDAVAALAAELSVLAAQLDDGPAACRHAGTALEAGLAGELGARAAQVAASWASLTALLGVRCEGIARTLRAAVESYAEFDSGLARQLVPHPTVARAAPR